MCSGREFQIWAAATGKADIVVLRHVCTVPASLLQASDDSSLQPLTYRLSVQGHRLHGARGHMLPPFLQMAGHGGTVSRRTANKKLTKLYWPSQKRSQKRLIVLLEPKTWKSTTKKNFPALRDGSVTPTFKLVSAPLLSCACEVTSVVIEHFSCSCFLLTCLLHWTGHRSAESCHGWRTLRG